MKDGLTMYAWELYPGCKLRYWILLKEDGLTIYPGGKLNQGCKLEYWILLKKDGLPIYPGGEELLAWIYS